MIGQNSFTLQNMINSIKPGIGNFNAGLGYPTQPTFQSPYPSPMEMTQQMSLYPPVPVPYPTVNQVPVELEYKPEYIPGPQQAPVVNYVQAPGLPTNPDLAGIPARTVAPPQGRYFNVQPTVPGYADRFQQTPQSINPYDLYGRRAYTPQRQVNYSKSPVGVVNYYNGQPVHPHIHSGWYGSSSYPFVKTAAIDPLTTQNTTIQNPYFQAQEEKRIMLMRQMQDRANIAAYYGLTYDEWVENHSAVYQLLSRCCSKYFGLSEEETERRANAWKPKKVEEILQGGYPPGAFGPDGNFTKEYAEKYCVDHERVEKIHKTLKVDIVTTNGKGEVIEVIHCKPSRKKYGWAKSRTMIENIERAEELNKKSTAYKAQVMEYMYNNAPERALDKTEYGPFEVVGELMKATYKTDMEERLRKQKIEMRVRRAQANTVSYYYTNTLADLYNQAREARLQKQRQEWSDLIDRVVPDEQLPEIRKEFERRAKEGRPYIVDGDWVIAKPGLDIVGLPLDVSVNKIIRMNTVTGEEEIYNPDKPMSAEIRAQVEEAVKHPNFYDLNMDREERWKKFSEAGWSSRRGDY